MQKNWYAVYTKRQSEKKVAAVLDKLKIENFCPLKRVKINLVRRTKIQYEPLFTSYVFLYISEEQIHRLNKISGVVNFLHWLGKPAIINKGEIEVLKDFTSNYQDIRLERINVNLNDGVKILDEPSYKREGNFISVKAKTVKVDLPSLGYTLIAEIEKDRMAPIQKEATVAESQHSLLNVSGARQSSILHNFLGLKL